MNNSMHCFSLSHYSLSARVCVCLYRFLNAQVERTLLRLAGEIPSPKLQVVFLINNYDHILLCLTERGVHSEETVRFEELLASQIALYVEEELCERHASTHAASLVVARTIACLKQAEHALSAGAADIFNSAGSSSGSSSSASASGAAAAAAAELALPSVIRQFASQWREGIDQIHLNVVRHFGDTSAQSASTASSSAALGSSSTQARTSTAAQVLKQVLTQLLLYYQRFHDLVKKYLAAASGNEALSAAARELVPFHTLMFEVKKFVNRV